MVQITGKYKRTSEKRYEDFLSKLGLNFMIRKAAMSSIPTMEITKCGDKWKIVTATKLRNVLLEFEMVRVGFNFKEYIQVKNPKLGPLLFALKYRSLRKVFSDLIHCIGTNISKIGKNYLDLEICRKC